MLVLALVTPAVADDLTPASWRGEADTVFAEWDFPTEADINPDPCSYYGPGYLETYAWDDGSWTWHDTFQGRQGVWQIDGNGGWDVANYLPTLGGKDIQVQITYYGDLEGMHTLENGWTHATLIGEFTTFNPDMESYYPYASDGSPPTGGLYIDQIVIETLHYTPEPATMVLLGLGGLMVIRRRK
jgi:hypothetical protein